MCWVIRVFMQSRRRYVIYVYLNEFMYIFLNIRTSVYRSIYSYIVNKNVLGDTGIHAVTIEVILYMYI
jgi:hypothetical protein